MFNSELSILAAKGNSVKRCWTLALEKASQVLGEDEFTVFNALPATGTFYGELSINGQKKPVRVVYSEFSFPKVF